VSDVSAHPPPDALWPALRVRAGESARDVAWLPTMCAHDTSTCLFASACKSQPVHLWSAVDGTVAASYGAKNRLDEPIDFTSLCFSRDGARVFAGAADAIRTWDLTRPGYHDVRTFWTGGKSKGRGSKRSKGRRRDEENGFGASSSSSFRGAVSTMACAPLSGATARVSPRAPSAAASPCSTRTRARC
jgi:WD40 repeat protein